MDLIKINDIFFNINSDKSFRINFDDFSTFNNENCIKRLNLKLNKFPRSNFLILDNEYFLENESIKDIVYSKYKIIGYEKKQIKLFGLELDISNSKNNYLLVVLYSSKKDEEELIEDRILRRYIPGILSFLEEVKPKELNIIFKHKHKKTELLTTFKKNNDNYIMNDETIVTNSEIHSINTQVKNIINQIKLNRKITPIKNEKRCNYCEWKNICKNI